MAQRELAIVGDIHGDADRLARALDVLLDKGGRHIIFVGDFVNRGPDSRRVMDLLATLQKEYCDSVTLLRGNHENALMEYLDGGDLSNFAAHGGLATIKSYLTAVRSEALEEFKATFPPAHRVLLENMQSSYEDDGLLVSHTGFDPNDPWARTAQALYTKGHPGLFTYDGPWPRPLTICGHYIQADFQPYNSPHFICLDTGCGTLEEAPLTVLTLPDRTFRQF